MTIIIIGGGIGGLALAAGLRRHGVDVTVVDRDTDLSQTGGYHITLHAEVQAALGRLLEPRHLQTIMASAADGTQRDPDVFWDRKGRLIGRMQPVADPGIDIDRRTLRLVLAAAAGDTLIRGTTFDRYALQGEQVMATFTDGSTLTGDVLVGADGAHSVVIKQLVGHATNRPTGLVGVSGRTPVSRLSPSLAAKLGPRSSLAMGPHGLALYLGYLDPIGHARLDHPDLRASLTTEPTFIWGMMCPVRRSHPLTGASSAALRDATINLLRANGWSNELLTVIAQSTSDDIAMYRFNAASTNPDDLAPWQPSLITALGDAVHATPPTAGMGAGMAIRDTDDLVTALVAVRDGDQSLPVALAAFERRMRQRGSAALRAAMPVIRWIKATDTPIGSAITTVALPVLAATMIFVKPKSSVGASATRSPR